MKRSFLLLAFMIYFSGMHAQAPISEGNFQLNAGLGFSGHGLPVYGGLDYGVHKDITIGGELSYRSYSNRWGGSKYSHNVLGISGNANYHFNSILNIPSPWNFYAGLNLAYYNWNSGSGYSGSYSSGIGLGAQIGGRYYFNEQFGINLELGGGNVFSGGKIGITYRF
ncbi:MAG: hypothetical protein LAT51_11475 [Flavobacteriaceae bacterium]|nr:hypothetical protein [Flavobacteriaceae bacterium]